jgi:hypothetical protein
MSKVQIFTAAPKRVKKADKSRLGQLPAFDRTKRYRVVLVCFSF